MTKIPTHAELTLARVVHDLEMLLLLTPEAVLSRKDRRGMDSARLTLTNVLRRVRSAQGTKEAT